MRKYFTFQAQEILDKFMSSKKAEGSNILAADNKLTEDQKKIEGKISRLLSSLSILLVTGSMKSVCTFL